METDGGLTLDGEQFLVTPKVARARLDGLAADGLGDGPVVVSDLERAEAELTDMLGADIVVLAALATLKSGYE